MAYGLMCPHCGEYTAFVPVEYRKAVQGGGNGDWQEVFLASGTIYDEHSGYTFGTSRCQACGNAFSVRFRANNTVYPDRSVVRVTLEALWPTRYKAVPSEIPSPVREAMEDASAALGAGSLIGAMLAVRTALLRAQEHQKEVLKLEKASLKALFEAGLISRFEFESGDLARRWANFLGHEEPDPGKDLSREEVEELYEYVAGLLDSIYVKPAKMERSRSKLKGETA
ncbi:MAG: hypothetical protein FJ317_08395 [SAR202 cluster bacterium]|nr:hypothetical protein [SAR202 cluster bacterium]